MSCTHPSACRVDVLYTPVCLSGRCLVHTRLLVGWMSCTHPSACRVDVLYTPVCLSGGCLVHTCESCELASGFEGRPFQLTLQVCNTKQCQLRTVRHAALPRTLSVPEWSCTCCLTIPHCTCFVSAGVELYLLLDHPTLYLLCQCRSGAVLAA